jgi:hypothetical protein
MPAGPCRRDTAMPTHTRGKTMDKIIRIICCLLLIILVPFAGIGVYNGYVESAYRNTITGTYNYTCIIATAAPLYDVTLFIPVPTDRSGNSPWVSGFSSGTMNGIPADWETTLYDTGKATVLKVTTSAIQPPEGTTASSPYTVILSSETTERFPVETRDPVAAGVLFRPPQSLREQSCPPAYAGTGSRCFTYTTSLFADYNTSAENIVTITSSVDGRNAWKIFEPRSNEYHTMISITLQGENHGWTAPSGRLYTGIGTYDAPVDF